MQQEKRDTDQQLLAVATKALQKIKEIESDPKWEQFADSPCLMFKMQTDNRVLSKGEINVKIPIDVLFDKLSQQESLKLINPQLLEIKVLHKISIGGKEARVNYMRYQGLFPVEDRDLVNVAMKQKGDGICWIATQACNFPYPKPNKTTRATCNIGGWILKKIDEENTQLIYISDVELAGLIPQMIKNLLSQKQAGLPARVEEALKEFK